MRKETDTCLLCLQALSTKKNSHILPKFLSTKFLGSNGPRRGYEIGTDTAFNEKQVIVQDSPKEDYILCPDCESYLGIVEGLSSHHFNNWKQEVANGNYTSFVIHSEVEVIECLPREKSAIHLLVYSIFWRASVSNHTLFQHTRLDDKFEESLRIEILKFKSQDAASLKSHINTDFIGNIFPYAILTCKSFTNDTGNILYSSFNMNPYSIISDQFVFVQFETITSILPVEARDIFNTTFSDSKLIVFSNQLWNELVTNKTFSLINDTAHHKKTYEIISHNRNENNKMFWDRIQEHFPNLIIKNVKGIGSSAGSHPELPVIHLDSLDPHDPTLAHEMLHIYLDTYITSPGSVMEVKAADFRWINSIFRQSDFYDTGNLLSHTKMLPLYIKLGYEKEIFIKNYAIKEVPSSIISDLKKYYPTLKGNRDLTIRYVQNFVKAMSLIKGCINPSIKYFNDKETLKKTDKNLHDTVDSFWNTWDKINIFEDQDANTKIDVMIQDFYTRLDKYVNFKIGTSR